MVFLGGWTAGVLCFVKGLVSLVARFLCFLGLFCGCALFLVLEPVLAFYCGLVVALGVVVCLWGFVGGFLFGWGLVSYICVFFAWFVVLGQ